MLGKIDMGARDHMNGGDFADLGRRFGASFGCSLDCTDVTAHDDRDETTANFVQYLENEFEAGSSYLPNKADWFEGRWQGFGIPGEPVDARRNVNTAITEDEYARLSKLLTTVPDGLTIHKTLGRIPIVNRPIKYGGDKQPAPSAPPVMGEHTDDILADVLGLSPEQIEQLRAAKVVA